MRLFVGIHPPEESVRALIRAAPWREMPAHRRIEESQLHLTVIFIGEVAESALGGVVESVDRAAAGASSFVLVPERLVSLPKEGNRRTLAIVTSGPEELLAVRSRLVRRLARDPRPDPNDRFLPHITLARFSPPAPEQSVPPDRELQAIPPIPVNEIHLIQSKLRPWGAVHMVVASFPLG